MNIEAEAARIVATAKAEAEHFARFGRRGDVQQQPSAVPAAQAVPTAPTSQENHMTVSARLADAEKAVEALAGHIKALASNPLVDGFVEDGLGLLLTPGEIIAVRAFVAAIEAGRTPAAGVVQAGEAAVQAFQAGGAQQLQQTAQGPAAPAIVR